MSDFLHALLMFFFGVFLLLAAPFIVVHVADTWDAPAYPHSGFSPECPIWEESENTLPPTDGHATCCADDL